MGTQRLDFAEFYRRSKDDCLRTVLISVGDQDTAQELVAEAFARACASWRTVSTHPNPAAWVVRTALNANISRWRRRRREVSLPDLSVVADLPAGDRIADSPADPRIMAALIRLPARQRQVIALRLIRARRRVPALAAALAVTAAVVVAVTSLTAGSQAGRGVSAVHSLQARLLAAITAAHGDILMTRGPPSPHTGTGYELTYPWDPRPGQQVIIRTIGWATNGKLWGEAESTFTMPAGHGTRTMNPVDGEYDLTVTRTFIVVYPAQHAWGEWRHNTQIVGLPVDAAGIRHELAKSQFKIIRRDVVDGRKAIELGMTGLNPRMTGLHTTAALLWVDAASYLPLRQVLRFSTGRVDITDYKFLPPTPANLAKLRVVIPAGYHRTWLLPGQARHHKPLSQAQQRRQQRQALAFVACMHRNGFPQLPGNWSGNVGQLISAGIAPNSPRFNAALTKCGPW